jgi:hypothetical protein
MAIKTAHWFSRGVLLSFIVCAGVDLAAQTPPPKISDVVPIELSGSKTHVQHFGVADARATIVKTRAGHGLHQYEIVEERSSTSSFVHHADTDYRPFLVRIVVPFAKGGDRKQDSPFIEVRDDDQDVMFAQATIDDRSMSVLVLATKPNWRSREPSPVAFTLYEVERSPTVDAKEDVFQIVAEWTTALQYCDIHYALAQTLAVKSKELPQSDKCK